MPTDKRPPGERTPGEQMSWLHAAQSAREAARRRHVRFVDTETERATIAQLVVSEAPAWVTDAAKREFLRGLG
jgi:hypothetical protein